MARWYFSAGSNSARIGPLDDNAASAHAQQHPEDFCWREGFAAWQPVGDVAELNATRATAPPSMPALPSTGSGGGRDDEIDYRIVGSDMQFVEVELRSEEHTSELQSLMRISYADFCLKKKKQ